MPTRTTISHRDLMLATPGRPSFTEPGWIYELKMDGYRILCIKDQAGARLLTRNGIDLSRAFPELIMELEGLPAVVLDGELVALDDMGVPQFERLFRRAAMRRKPPLRAGGQPSEAIAIFAFDVLSLRGRDLRSLPLLQRKARLAEVLKNGKRIRWLQHVTEGASLYATVQAAGLEGVVAKRADAPYVAGKTSAWRKFKTAAFKAIEAKRMEHRRR